MQSKGSMAKKEKKAGNKEAQGPGAGSLELQNERIAKTPPKAKPKPKPKSAADRRKDRIDGITKTVYPAVLGVIAGFVCYFVAGEVGDSNWQISTLPWHFVLMSAILATALIQKFTFPFLKVDSASFQTKDWLYVEFIMLSLLLVTWTLLLN
jgi:hypothetical protein